MPAPKPHQRANGTIAWRVRFRLTPGGNPVTETFDDIASAKTFCNLVDRVGGVAARQARDASTASSSGTPTLAAATARHLELLSASVTPGTVHRYRKIADSTFLQDFGHLPVDAITSDDVTAWVGKMRKEVIVDGPHKGQTPTPKTLRNRQALLSSVLQRCVDDGHITKNPAKGVKLPSDAAASEMRFLSENEFAELFDRVDPHYQTFVATLYGLGLRWGEATALTPSDISLDAAQPVVRVTKAWKQGVGSPYIGSPKTKRAVRTVTIPSPLVPLLREQARDLAPDALLFPNKSGKPLRTGTFYANVWMPAVTAAGLTPRPRVHDLRHSHASALIAAGIPLPVIQRRLGHESIKTTVDRYGHVMPEAYALAADAAGMALTQALPQIEG